MASTIKPQILKGTRDLLPQKMLLRNHVMGVIRSTFERFGFQPLETPAIELAQTLEGKYGEEEQLIYKFTDRGGRRLGLRYDLTVPLCRVIAMYPELPKPFKRYQLQPVWRADKPRKGRYREFWQCDADTVGSASMLADAEIVTVIYTILRQLGFTNFTIRLNNRKLLTGLCSYAGVAQGQEKEVLRALDKLDKGGIDAVRQQLLFRDTSNRYRQFTSTDEEEDQESAEEATEREVATQEPFLHPEVVDRLLDLVTVSGGAEAVLFKLKGALEEVAQGREGIGEMEEMLLYLDQAGVPQESYKVDLTLARGLDYYTGPIYETVVEQKVKEGKIGSVTGGGRYDELIGMFSGRSLPAAGTTIGLERIVDVLEQLGTSTGHHAVQGVLVAVFDNGHIGASLRLVTQLRGEGLNSELYLGTERLSTQLQYAGRRGFSHVLILGPEEASNDTVTVRDMASGQQSKVSQAGVAAYLKSRLA